MPSSEEKLNINTQYLEIYSQTRRNKQFLTIFSPFYTTADDQLSDI